MTFAEQFDAWKAAQAKFKADRVADQRAVICSTCKHHAPALNICKKCWCPLGIKTLLMEAQCPIHKW